MTKFIKRIFKEEAGGTTLIYALLMVFFGGLMVPPMMDFVDNGLGACQIYEQKTDEIYAADSGIEDALWRVKYGDLEEMFPDPAYDMYDYYTSFDYTMDNQVNDCDVNVSIENMWIPKDITAPAKTDARTIIETGKLIVTGNIPDTESYQIRITYYPDTNEAGDLMVDSIGIWLPTGFTYVEDSSNLEELTVPLNDYYCVPTVTPHCGGEAVVWDFSSDPSIATLPGANPLDTPIIADITFDFDSTQAGVNPTAMAWIETSGVSGIEFSWDADIKIFGITSIAGSATAEAHLAKIGLRDLGSSIEGDYRAIGGTLMRDTNGDANGIRDVLDSESSATVNDIPSDAGVVGAFLYWTGWFGSTIYEDDCRNMSDWYTSGNYWRPASGCFRGHANGSTVNNKYMTYSKNDTIDLSGYTEGDVVLRWEQDESGNLEGNDAVWFRLSPDNETTWSSNILAFADDNPVEDFEYTIPQAYLTSDFTMGFYLEGFAGSGEYCYLDNIIIAVTGTTLESDESAFFEINGTQVYLDANDDPQTGAQDMTASSDSVLLNEQGYSYACFLDVTKLVQAYSNLGAGTNRTGNATYTVGGVDGDTGNSWSYAGWSLIIVYASAETEGHQLFIYDDFAYAAEYSNVDFDNDGNDGGTITGFLVPDQIAGETNAAQITCFVGEGDDCWNGDSLELNGTALSNADSPSTDVWNSQSPGLAADGVDIDTFDITWASSLITAGDSSVQLDMDTGVDSWNLVYIIFSVRSEVITGGAMDYMLDF